MEADDVTSMIVESSNIPEDDNTQEKNVPDPQPEDRQPETLEKIKEKSAFTLRYYQDLIAAQATKTNTIVYLPTGTGKTFIAFRVIEYRLQFIRIARDNPNEWPRVIIFIAPKRALLHQQIQSIRKFCAGAKAEEFGGGTLYNNKKIDEWGLDEWRYHLQRYEVLGMTPATLQVLLEKSLLPPHTIDLLVLDECHHATGNDPMAKVCDALKLSGMSPLILGLTASPIKSKHMRVRKAIERLEQRTMSTFFSPTEEYLQSVRQFAFKPPAVIVSYADVSLVAEEEPQKTIAVGEDEMDLAPTIPFETPKKVGEVHHEFLSALEEMKHLYRRLHCADCIQQLHDSDILLKRRAFTLVAQKLGIENPMLISFQGIRHIRECMRQLCEVTRSCGVYFGLQSIIFYLQKVISMMGKRRYRVLFQEDFEATLLASTSQAKECVVMSDSEGSKVGEEGVEGGKSKEVRIGEPMEAPEDESNKSNDAVLSQESRITAPAASTAHGSESPQLWKTLKLSRRMRFAGPELTDELLGDDDDCFLFSDGTGDESEDEDAREVDEEDEAADESTVKSDGTGMDSEGDPFLATFEDSHLIEEPSLAFKSEDFSPDYIAFLLDTGKGKGESNVPVMDIDWSQVDIPEEETNNKTRTSPQEDTKSKSKQFHKRRLKHQTYHTYDFDQMRRSTPMIFQLIDNDASYFQFMVNQFVCGIVTILQGFQHLMSLFTTSLLEKVIQEYSPVAVEVTNETKSKHPVRAAANLLVKYMRGSMEKNFCSWKEMMDDIRLLQQRSLAYEIVTVAKLISRCISLQPLEVPIKPCRKIDQRNHWESLVASIEATDAAEKEDEVVYLQRKEDAYFFPKIVRLFSVLRSIWHRGEVNDADTYTHYDFMTEKPYLNKIDGFEWIDRLKSALQSSTSRATATIEEDGSSQKATPYSQMPSTIVFCNKKVMACGLTALLHDLWFDRNVTAGVLTGDIPIEQQRGVLESFRNERVQVLFATEVAEEGLDIKQCSSIVNFDPPATAKAFIQRRGRARGQNSLNINVWPSPGTNSLLFEALSRDLQGFLSTERRFDDQFVMYTQTLLSQQHEEAEKYTVESTGAYVDYVSAQALVYDYCQSLLHVTIESKGDGEDPDETPKITVIEDSGSTLPFYTFESYEDPIMEEKVYVTTLHLPPKVEAPPFAWTASKKQQGKGRAALDAVRFLHKKGVLDDHLRVVNHLRDISPFESLVADRRSKKHLKQFKDEDDAALDGDEDKVDLLVKVVADDLTKTPTVTIEEPMQVNDSETIQVEPPASISLHFYCVQVASLGVNRKPSQDPNAKRELQKVTKEGLLALQGLAFAVPSIADARFEECVFQSILRELKDERFTWTFHYLGERAVSQEEVAMMQAFHRAVFAVGAPSFPSTFKDKYGYVDPEQALSMLSAMTPEASNLRAEMFPFHDAATWTRSSNHAWYLVLPVKVTRAPLDPAALIPSIKFEDIYDASFIRDEAITAAVFVSNLKVIQDCNNSVETANPLATIDSINEQPRTPQEYDEWVFTSTGRMMFRIDAETPCTLKVSDIADSKKKLTFLQLFQKRGPQTVAWIDEQMKKRSATLTLIVPEKDTSSTVPAETVANKEIEWPETLQMRLITLLSTKLTLWNFIGKQIGAHLHGDRAAPTNRGRQQFILPPLSQPIGRPRHYYQIMILPGLAYRWVSLCLARELRQSLQCRLVKKVVNQSFVQRLLAQPAVSASKNEAIIIEEYTPKLITLLEAMTTSRAQEMFQSERLEFLGDSFLKLAASVEVYTTFPYAAEGELTMRRRHLICNRTLSQLATKDGLAEYLRVLPLSRGLEEVYFTAPGLYAMGTSDDDATGGGRWITALRNANLQKGATASAIAAALARKNAAAAAAAAVTEEASKAVTDDVHVAQAYQPESIRDQRQFLRQLPGKVLADIMESLLGTCVLLNDEYLSASFAMVYALRMVPHNFAESWLLSTPAEREQRFHFPLHTSIAALMAPHPNHLASELLAVDTTNEVTTPASADVVASDSDTEAPSVTAAVEGEEKNDQAAEAKPIEGITKDSIAATALLQQQRRICLPLESATTAVIEKRLNYHFTCPNLLAVAFTHASMSYEYISYERLEFLGDAVLDFIVAKILYDLHPDWDEGHLSHSKHEHTNNKYLSTYGEQLDVLSLVRHNSSAIFRELHQRHQKAKESKRAGKVKASTTKTKGNVTAATTMDVDVDGVPLLDKPKSTDGTTIAADGEEGGESAATAVSDSITKVQADVIEALVGAVYLDCGGNVAIVELMLRHLGMLGESLQIKPVFTSVPNGGPTTAGPAAAGASTTSSKVKARSKAKNKAKAAIASAEEGTTTAVASTTGPTVMDSTPHAATLALKTPENCAASTSAMDVDDKAETPGVASIGSTASPGPASTANSRRKRRAPTQTLAGTAVVLGSTGQDADADDEAIGEDDDDEDLLSPLTRSKRRRTDSALLPAFPCLPK